MKHKYMTKDAPEETALSEGLLKGYEEAQAERQAWTPLWRDCYDYALPQRNHFGGAVRDGAPKTDHLYDATAMDAADQLAASLLGHLTPPRSQWFGLKPGPELSPSESESLAPVLEKAGKIIQDHFDRSNFAVEIHQCYLDLIVGGTAALAFEENSPGEFSAFRFTALPLNSVFLQEGKSGRLDHIYRNVSYAGREIAARYNLDSGSNAEGLRLIQKDPEKTFNVLEVIQPNALTTDMHALLLDQNEMRGLLASGSFQESPIIAFRWLKTPSESYGRSPVMKALPDIKTANKVVELILKNASIAVTGIWQADDDGVLNPANIELTPGAIIPKAIGSQGLQPLNMPGQFDISQIVLEDLRGRIRHALMTDRLGPIGASRMTATEVLERSSEMALLLGATYGRLQSELLTPLIKRAFSILKQRGEIPDLQLDGRLVAVDYRSPLARAQGQRNVQNTLSWINAVLAMGSEAAEAIDLGQAARFLGEAMGVPSDLIKNNISMQNSPGNGQGGF